MQRRVQKVAVVGAGMAGITCARRLADADIDVTVFEGAKSVGGRMGTYDSASGIRFDHGAQFATADTESFQEYIGERARQGRAAQWDIHGEPYANAPVRSRWIGVPTMDALLAPAAEALHIEFGATVARLHSQPGGVVLSLEEDESEFAFDAAVIAVPAPDAIPMLEEESELVDRLSKIEFAPCWAVTAAFESPLDHEIPTWKTTTGPVVWAARNGSRSGRPGWQNDKETPDCWVFHAGPDWSQEHADASPADVRTLMLRHVEQHCGSIPEIRDAKAHLWRNALVTEPLNALFLASRDSKILIGGDWCLGPRIECAFRSGTAIADALVVRSLGQGGGQGFE